VVGEGVGEAEILERLADGERSSLRSLIRGVHFQDNIVKSEMAPEHLATLKLTDEPLN
jgi:hypothetical protein